MDKSALEAKNVAELQEIAGTLGVEGLKNLRKGQLIDAIIQAGNGDGASARSPEENGGGTATATEPTTETEAADGAAEAPPVERREREDRGPREDGQGRQGGGGPREGGGGPRDGGGRQRLARDERRR